MTGLKAGDPFEVIVSLTDGCENTYPTNDYSKLAFDFGKTTDSMPNCAVTTAPKKGPLDH
jgi:hypothetical protein